MLSYGAKLIPFRRASVSASLLLFDFLCVTSIIRIIISLTAGSFVGVASLLPPLQANNRLALAGFGAYHVNPPPVWGLSNRACRRQRRRRLPVLAGSM